jgi:hypothetical protein
LSPYYVIKSLIKKNRNERIKTCNVSALLEAAPAALPLQLTHDKIKKNVIKSKM